MLVFIRLLIEQKNLFEFDSFKVSNESFTDTNESKRTELSNSSVHLTALDFQLTNFVFAALMPIGNSYLKGLNIVSLEKEVSFQISFIVPACFLIL